MKTIWRNARHLTLATVVLLAVSCGGESPATVTLSKDVLMDKIKGGWAGQTFGCTYGGPTEFKFNGVTIPDDYEIPWADSCVKWWYDNVPGLYDDVYMDLTFVDVYDKYGLDVPVDSMANAFAYASYRLWHANQAARYNILNGLKAPESGHWKNNPHADDIDFQIEADFAGLMSPGMPNSASAICDGIGHIMNYGNGWYGGVYVAAMYALAFVSNDIEYIVTEALKTIPAESTYYQCVSDAIRWSKENADWRTTWQLIEEKWSDEMTCPIGVKNPFNIEASVNSAYVVMGLLYGAGDMERTLDVSTRCGADSDCNPATAAGILGTMLGYSNIPEKWIKPLQEVEDVDFAHTDISLDDVYGMSFAQALQMIERGGGKVGEQTVEIPLQTPQPVRFEQSFEGLRLVSKQTDTYSDFRKPFSCEFEGSGIVCAGDLYVKNERNDYIARLEVEIDGQKEIVEMPADFAVRRFDIYWNYDLPEGSHVMKIRWLNPVDYADIVMNGLLVYARE